jgi:hypothetical protein
LPGCRTRSSPAGLRRYIWKILPRSAISPESSSTIIPGTFFSRYIRYSDKDFS